MSGTALQSKTEEAWSKLFERLDIGERLAVGACVYLSANDMKTISGREPRLLSKFDSRSLRPTLLKDATILPVSNGQYVIVPGDAYHNVEPVQSVRLWRVPAAVQRLVTLPWTQVPASESQVLDMALLSGALGDFLEEDGLVLTIRGRLRSPKFQFEFPHRGGTETISVDGVQIEVDGGLEGEYINLAEVKLGRWDDFLLRQIYYPFRMWTAQASSKPSRGLFVAYSDKVLTLRLYSFDPVESITNPKLLKAVDYEYDFGDDEAPADVGRILARVRLESMDWGVPFPQADRLERVLNVVDAVAAGRNHSSEIAAIYGFDIRQAAYYPAAAGFLGLIERREGKLHLTRLGQQFIHLPRRRRHSLVLEQLARRPVFRDALEWVVSHEGAIPDAEAVAGMIERGWTGPPITGTTVTRRAQTVRKWLEWLLSSLGEPSASS